MKWMKRAVLGGAILFMISMYFFDVTIPVVSQAPNGFRGLAHEKAIEQAQIAREIARGNGFSTQMIRPAALWQFQLNKGAFPIEHPPDTYHAPLHPFINAGIFRMMDAINSGLTSLAKNNSFFLRFTYETTMTTKLVMYAYDKMIAFAQTIFFLLAVLVSYFTAKRLFDERLAVLGCGLLLLCETFWDFSMSGLPQMLMLLLFSGATYTLVRAVEAKCEDKSPLWWLVATAAQFGLLALTHALTIWMFVGALFFCAFFFRPMGRHAAIMLGVFLLFYVPWMVRNYQVCGSVVGVGWYGGLHDVSGSESKVMRSMELDLDPVTPRVFRQKIQKQTLSQLASLYQYLGSIPLALVFFVALLHLFKRPDTGALRWGVLSMWIFAVFGMSLFGFSESGGPQANNLHVLFIPLMTFYGLALVLVMWTRLEVNIKLLQRAFIALLLVISALPFIDNFLDMIGQPRNRIQWPPYVPPYIAILGQWTNEREIISSDMPWAVAWYADRKSLWLPISIKDFVELNDYNQLKGQIVGLYLTPITGNLPFIANIVKGEYKEWSPFITRTANIKDFPLKAVTALPMDNECIFYSDRDRWTNREE